MPAELLTRSETKVLKLLIDGLTPQQCADEIGIALSTVRSHIKQLHRKTETHSLVSLVA